MNFHDEAAATSLSLLTKRIGRLALGLTFFVFLPRAPHFAFAVLAQKSLTGNHAMGAGDAPCFWASLGR